MVLLQMVARWVAEDHSTCPTGQPHASHHDLGGYINDSQDAGDARHGLVVDPSLQTKPQHPIMVFIISEFG